MKQTKRARALQSGFTLVELSIVLVIIGLIIGGVLTGQQIMQNARITNAINAIQAYQGQFQTYVQNYGALPGSDKNASDHFPNIALPNGITSPNGGGLGTVGTGNSFNTQKTALYDSESLLVWVHLRAAGLVKNQPGSSSAVQPPNPFNGVFGFQNGAFGSVFTTTTLCLDKVPAAAAQAMDSRLDDGKPDGGAIQATTGAVDGTPASSYVERSVYTVCIRL